MVNYGGTSLCLFLSVQSCTKILCTTVRKGLKPPVLTNVFFFYDNQELNHIKTGAIIDALTLLAIIPFPWTCLILIFFLPHSKKKGEGYIPTEMKM